MTIKKARGTAQARRRDQQARAVVAGSARYNTGAEPLSKKHARLLFWEDVAFAFSARRERFLEQRFLVLSSGRAGDVGVLRGLGVPAEHIVAVDLSADAIAAASRLHKGVRFIHGDLFDVAPTVPHDVSLLDFCCPLDQKLALRVQRYLGECTPSVFGIGVMRGREQPGNYVYQTICDIRDRKSEAGQFVRNMVDRWWPKLDDGILRSVVTAMLIVTGAAERGAVLRPRFLLQYQSKVPMTYTTFFCSKSSRVRARDTCIEVFANGLQEAFEHGNVLTGERGVSTREIRNELATAIAGVEPSRGALLLGEPQNTLAAWKAMATRDGWINKSERERLECALLCAGE